MEHPNDSCPGFLTQSTQPRFFHAPKQPRRILEIRLSEIRKRFGAGITNRLFIIFWNDRPKVTSLGGQLFITLSHLLSFLVV